MGNQKQKWTAEEEDALQRGVQKHGAGKWKNILKDPEFAASLTNRSNIDLKDKWRNLNVGNGQGSKDKSRTPKTKPIVPPPAPSPANATPATAPAPSPASVPTPQIVTPSPQSQSHSQSQSQSQSHHSSQNDHDDNIPPRYNAMIFEALATIKDTNGSDINAIVSFIEKKHKVPQNFRRALGSRLRRLVNQGKLEKVQNCYKIKKDTPLGTKSPAPKSPVLKQKDVWPQQTPASSFLTSNETFKDAADTAAYRVADAENKSFLASEAVKEVEKFSKMAEDIDSMLQLAQEVFEQCTADKQPYLLINKF